MDNDARALGRGVRICPAGAFADQALSDLEPRGSSRRADSAVPFVVVLHGCAETSEQVAAASGYDRIAEQRRFVVLYPGVDAIDQGYEGCWKGIWEPRAEGRGRGDAGAIAEMTRAVIARRSS